MKKKGFLLFGSAALLSLALAGTIGAVAASADTTISAGSGDNSGTTTVTYTVADTWNVTIPDTIELKSSGTTSATVTASDVVIEKGTQLTVTVASGKNWEVKDSADNQGFAYELKSDKSDTPDEALNNSSNNKVLEVDAGDTDGDTANLTASLKSENTQYSTGGEAYEDTLTFTVTVD